MNELLTAFLAIGGTLAAVGGAFFSLRRLSKAGVFADQQKVSSTLRDLLDVSEKARGLLNERNLELVDRLAATIHDLDTCSRQRDDLYAQMREK